MLFFFYYYQQNALVSSERFHTLRIFRGMYEIIFEFWIIHLFFNFFIDCGNMSDSFSFSDWFLKKKKNFKGRCPFFSPNLHKISIYRFLSDFNAYRLLFSGFVWTFHFWKKMVFLQKFSWISIWKKNSKPKSKFWFFSWDTDKVVRFFLKKVEK